MLRETDTNGSRLNVNFVKGERIMQYTALRDKILFCFFYEMSMLFSEMVLVVTFRVIRPSEKIFQFIP